MDWRRRISALLAGPGPTMVFQPIYRLADDARMGFEALARFPSDLTPADLERIHGPNWRDGAYTAEGPSLWFQMAEREGLGVALEVAAIRATLLRLPDVPAEHYVGINVGPETLLSGDLFRALWDVDLSRVVVELTEHHAIEAEHVEAVRAAIDALHSYGAAVYAKPSVAMDDFGEGSASFKLLMGLRSRFAYVKLDMSLTRHIDTDPGQQVIVEAIVRMGHGDGFRVVAEGVETQAQADTLRTLGVHSAQGYLLGKPGPLPMAA